MDWIEVSNIILGSVVGGFIAIAAYAAEKLLIEKRRDTETRNLDFIERQLEEFYSPMIGCLMKIRAKNELGYKISKLSEEAWKELCARQPKPFLDHEKYYKPYGKSLEYNNTVLKEEVIPLYDQMIDLFTEKYWLANPSTREWYAKFSEFIYVWHRALDKAIPFEVALKIEHSEANVKPFYVDLEDQLNLLQEILAKGKISAKSS